MGRRAGWGALDARLVCLAGLVIAGAGALTLLFGGSAVTGRALLVAGMCVELAAAPGLGAARLDGRDVRTEE